MKTNINQYFVNENVTIRSALERLDRLSQSENVILFVLAKDNLLIGSLTDGDVRRGMLKGYSLESKVSEICKHSPTIFKKGEYSLAKIKEYRSRNPKLIPVFKGLANSTNCTVTFFLLVT